MLDTLFSLMDSYKFECKFDLALDYAKQHTELNIQIYKRTNRCSAYAFMLEA